MMDDEKYKKYSREITFIGACAILGFFTLKNVNLCTFSIIEYYRIITPNHFEIQLRMPITTHAQCIPNSTIQSNATKICLTNIELLSRPLLSINYISYYFAHYLSYDQSQSCPPPRRVDPRIGQHFLQS